MAEFRLDIRSADSLNVTGSYHDPITCKVSAENTRRMARYSPFGALPHLVGAQHVKIRFHFSEQLPGHSRRRYFAYGRIMA
jgi:hypothetical protein